MKFFSFCCFFEFAVDSESDSYFGAKQDDTPRPVDPDKQNGDHRQHAVNQLIRGEHGDIKRESFLAQLCVSSR